MADIISTKHPVSIEVAYGKVILSLYDNDLSTNTRMAVRIFNQANALIADLRQLPNPAGYAHFDLSNVLKSRVTVNSNIEVTDKITTSPEEIIKYKIEYGYVPFNGVFVSEGIFDNLHVINGRKKYTIIDWDKSPYSPAVSYVTTGNPTNQVDYLCKALTDRPYTQITGASISDGKPSWVGNATVVNKTDIIRGDDFTLSFLSDWRPNPTVAPWTTGINGFRLAVYNGSTVLYNQTVPNLLSNGGGPNNSNTGTTQPIGQFKALSFQAGFINTLIAAYLDTATHIYVSTAIFGRDPNIVTNYISSSEVYRLNVTDGECNDFENIEISWLNSFGFRDYFNFQKRIDRQVDVTKKTYKQLDAAWGSNEIVVNPYNRGERVYDQSADITYTVNTRYLTDEESAYLENLYISPDIKAKIDGEWVSVIPVTNSYTQKTFRKDRLFQHQLQFKLANQNLIQRG